MVKFKAIFKIFSNDESKWKKFRTVKFSKFSQFLSILIMAINSQTKVVLSIAEQLKESGKTQKKRLNKLKQKKHT